MVLPQVDYLRKPSSLTIARYLVDVAVLQVSQQRTAFTYQHCQSSFCTIIFSVELQVLSQVSNTVGKQSYLSLS